MAHTIVERERELVEAAQHARGRAQEHEAERLAAEYDGSSVDERLAAQYGDVRTRPEYDGPSVDERPAAPPAGKYTSATTTSTAAAAAASSGYLTGLSASRVEELSSDDALGADDSPNTSERSGVLAQRAREMIARHEAKRREISMTNFSSGSSSPSETEEEE